MTKNAVTFENGNRASVITAPRNASAKAILDALEIAGPRAVILLFGGAAGLDDRRKNQLATLFADGVTPIAAELGALIIDGGTQSGVMAIIGEAVARSRAAVQLLGVAPKAKITHPEISGASVVSDGAPLEPNHSHFILVESNKWGGETTKMLEVARAFNAPIVEDRGHPVCAASPVKSSCAPAGSPSVSSCHGSESQARLSQHLLVRRALC
jgi:hypothetical protein